METPPDKNKPKKEYSKPLTIFEASSYIKGSVPIIPDSKESKESNKENEKGKGPDFLFPVNLLF